MISNYKKPTQKEVFRRANYFSLFFALLMIFIYINSIFGVQMFNMSIKISLYLQEYDAYKISYFFSEIFFYMNFLYIMSSPFLQDKKTRAFMYNIELGVVCYISNAAKLFFRDSRPSFEADALKQGGKFCENDYGMPSAHTMIVVNLTLVIISDVSKNFSQRNKKIANFIGAIASIAVSITRLFFGVHSINQVVMGFLGGVTLFWGFQVIEGPLCENIIIPLIRGRVYPKLKTRAMSLLTISMMILMIILCFAFNHSYKAEIEESFYIQFKFVNCKHMLDKLPRFSYRLFYLSSSILFTYFYFLGIYFQQGNFEKMADLKYDGNKFFTFLRTFLMLFSSLIVNLFKLKTPYTRNQTILALTIGNICYCLAGLSLTFYIFKVFKFLGIPFKSIEKQSNKLKKNR